MNAPKVLEFTRLPDNTDPFDFGEMPDYTKTNYDVDNPPEHTKLVLRGFNSRYWNGKEIVQRSGYRLLKTPSCKGCPTCDWIFDEALRDYLDASDDLGEIEHGATYEITLRKETEGWEYPNVWWYEIDIDMVLDKHGQPPKKNTASFR
jgi:hypothetical protein